MGIVALFVALGGTSYAATQLPSNSVGSSQIRAGAVTAAKIHNGSITAAKLSRSLKAQLQRGGGAQAEAAWRDPAMIAAIGSAGQDVTGQRVITVAADVPWVNTGLSIASGGRLWIDTRSDGRWSGNPKYFPYSDANGLPVYPGQYRVDAKANVESLIGFIGSSPLTPPEVSVAVSAPAGGAGGLTNPGFVEVGNTLLNFEPKTVGTIWLRNNDNTNYFSDVGRQIVKVVVTAPRS
jgi:hypothetical protein